MHSKMNDCGVDIVRKTNNSNNEKWEVYEDNAKCNKNDEFSAKLAPKGYFDSSNPSHLGGVDKLPQYSNLRMFREGYSPNWEDYKNGGQLSMRLKKDSTLRNWKLLVAAVMEGRMPHMDHMMGMVLSIRPGSNAAHIWCADSNAIQKNTEIMKYVLSLMNVHVVYVPFQVLKERNVKNQEKASKKAAAFKKLTSDGKRRSSDSCSVDNSDNLSIASTESFNLSGSLGRSTPSAASDGTRTPASEAASEPAAPRRAAPKAAPAVDLAVAAARAAAAQRSVATKGDGAASIVVPMLVASVAVVMMAVAVATAVVL